MKEGTDYDLLKYFLAKSVVYPLQFKFSSVQLRLFIKLIYKFVVFCILQCKSLYFAKEVRR